MIKAFKMRLEYGMGELFEEQHAKFWPEVEAEIHAYGGRNCTLFLDESTGYLFGTIEIDDEEKWAQIRDNAICQKWWDHIADTVKTNRDNTPVAQPLREVFHMD